MNAHMKGRERDTAKFTYTSLSPIYAITQSHACTELANIPSLAVLVR